MILENVFQIMLNVWEIADMNICMCSKYLTWTPTIKHPNIGDVDGRGKRCPCVTYPFKENVMSMFHVIIMFLKLILKQPHINFAK